MNNLEKLPEPLQDQLLNIAWVRYQGGRQPIHRY